MTKKLYIMSEGRTECNFVKYVLAEHLAQYDWIVIPTTLPTGHNKVGTHKGGWHRSDGYKHALKEIWRTVITHKNEVHTTFFDLYGFPSDIPCYEQAKLLYSPYEKAKLYEQQLKQDIDKMFANDSNYIPSFFVPYVQPYEFESFLFVDPCRSAYNLANGGQSSMKIIEAEIGRIAQAFETPEHINNSPDTAPSKRIEKIVPGFSKNKAGRAGFSWKVAQDVGVQDIRQVCRHFDAWLSSIESLNLLSNSN